MTSEDKYGIPEQPDDSCGDINYFITKVKAAMSSIQDCYKEINYGGIDEDNISDIEYYVEDFEDHFEWCRDQCYDLRKWGQAWKDLAKELIKVIETERHKEFNIEEDL